MTLNKIFITTVFQYKKYSIITKVSYYDDNTDVNIKSLSENLSVT